MTCHNDCQPGYGGTCIHCGEECTREEPETVENPRECTVCGELEGTYWAGKHCTYPEVAA